MVRYLNLSGNSGVIAYAAVSGGIHVQFIGGSVYEYTFGSAGPANVNTKLGLAERGQGLNTYINKNCRTSYSRKVR